MQIILKKIDVGSRQYYGVPDEFSPFASQNHQRIMSAYVGGEQGVEA
jgi:hypothetical protein